jgi:hypothetical protein
MDHLEYLKSGFEDAQKRFQETQARMQAMQAEFNVIAQEFNAWQTLYRAEMAKQGTMPLPESPKPHLQRANGVPRLVASKQPSQTDVVRAMLKERPAGMTPNEIWREVESQMTNRTYLYSVLKRLKERGDAIERRGKYYPKPEAEGGPTVVQ